MILSYALAAFFLWFILARLSPPVLWRFSAALHRLPRGGEMVSCPWCLGAWLAIIVTVAGDALQDRLEPITAVSALATAGLVGLIGTLLPDDGQPTEV